MAIAFYNAESALAWADELLTRPRVKCALTLMMAGPGGGSGNFEEIHEVAQTISLLPRMVSVPMAGEVFRYVFGAMGPGGEVFTADCLMAHMDVPMQPDPQRRLRFGMALLRSNREKIHRGKGWSKRRIGRFASIASRQFYQDGWNDRAAQGGTIIHDWLELAGREIGELLNDRGLLRDQEPDREFCG